MNKSLRSLPTINQIRTEKAKRNLIDFTTYTEPNYQVNWHHNNLANALDKMVRREIKRLMVFMPPRHGKSELVSRRFPAFILGKQPDSNIIATSYSGGLASSMNRDVQRIIDSEEYADLFPETTLAGGKGMGRGNYIRNSNTFEVVGHKGSYVSAGVGGSITGRGADFAIIDDPVKNRKDAESKTYRDNTFDWFASTLYTRLEKDACVLLTLTRWHEDDLAGRLLENARNNPEADQWHVINYPAIYDENSKNLDPTDPRKHDQALWPAKYDKKTLSTIKSTVGSYEWNALYNQNPSPPSGSIVKRDWLRYYKALPSKFNEILQSWDFAFGDNNGSSYVVGQVWGRIGADKYLIDQVRDRMDFTQSIRALKALTAKHPKARRKLIENKANGPAIMSTLRREVSGMVPVQPDGTKVERLYAVTPDFESGNVYIPDPINAPWVNDYVEELTSFPNAANDDQVDTTSQALNNMNKKSDGGSVKARSY